MTDLPPGWVRTTIGDVCSVVSGATPKTTEPNYWDGNIPWITPDDLSRNPAKITYHGRRFLTQDGFDSCSTQMIPANAVLFSSRAPIGYITISGNAVCTNQGFKTAVPPTGIDSNYLYWYLQFKVPEIRSRASGTTFKEISAKGFADTEMLVPPLAEQWRIVNALEDHLSRLDVGLSGLESNVQRVANWRSSLLAAAVSGKLIEPKSPWKVASIGDLAKVGTGATPLRSRKDYYDGGDIPWVTSGLLNEPFIDQADQFITSAALKETNVKLWPAGALLVAMYGEGKTRGKCAELRIPATTNQACAAIVFREESEWRRPWVKLFLQATYEKNRKLASGGVQPNLNLGLVRRIQIPLPSRSEQDEILAEMDRQLTIGDSLAAVLVRSRRRVDVLRAALLREAFTGRLVPQNPEDEPASVLLERIKAERTAMQTPKRRGSRTGPEAARTKSNSRMKSENTPRQETL
ncbi:restriction endonuclease subunit S [Nonomuraea angiospora]|uniref:Type I restriction enzyme S subunit n=1 Tax=Nonomuraea angiospora TaxID=46172 RepID=A0ABR9M9Q6_9ACTN|nr:restriction endonuclease subunit S [Nonomuraea angiospora]MBE1589046.1 type I restriction enzyme S subunit [Nonomuraea angiospora]